MMHPYMVVAILLLLMGGCINSTKHVTHQEDTSVRELLQAGDCTVSIVGISFRTPSVDSKSII
jgi:hypothetical protein